MTSIIARPAIMALAATTLLTACSSTPQAAPGERTGQDRTVEVQVTNNNWMDMTVYAMRGTARFRLGTVVTGNTERFRLPMGFDVNTGDLQLVADPVGSQEQFHSQPILVSPGSRVQWSLENHLALSSYRVR